MATNKTPSGSSAAAAATVNAVIVCSDAQRVAGPNPAWTLTPSTYLARA